MDSIFIRIIILLFSVSIDLVAVTNVFVGSFDPPKESELAPIWTSLHSKVDDQVIVIVDRHPISRVGYRFSAQERIERLKLFFQPTQRCRILFLQEPWGGQSAFLSALQPLLCDTLVVYDLRERGVATARLPAQKKIDIIQALHQEAFASYVREAAAHFPEMRLLELPPPPFDSKMSNFARVEQFIATALKLKSLSAKEAATFGEKSEKLLLSTERERLYPKMHCLQPIRREKRLFKPVDASISASTFTLPTPQSQEGHTLNVESYCAVRFPHALFTDGIIGEENTYFHMGSAEEAIDFHAEDGYTEQYEIFAKAVKKLRVNLLVRNPATGKVRLVICNMYGEDTLQHVALQFSQISRFHHVTLIRHANPNPFFEVDPLFQPHEFAPSDFLVLGFKNAISRFLLRKPEWKKQLYSVRGLSIDCYEHVDTKKRIILSKCVYGDQLTELLHHFYSKGVRRFQYFGTAGSLSSNLHVGDVIVPSHVYADGKEIRFNNRAAQLLGEVQNKRITFEARHGWVQSPMLETIPFLKRLQEVGVESLDVEARYYAHFFQTHTDAAAGLTLFISDEPFGNITLDQFNTMDHYIDEAFNSVYERLLPI